MYNKEIGQLLKSVPSDHKVAQALNYYSSHTAQIEVVRQDKSLEQVIQIVFVIKQEVLDFQDVFRVARERMGSKSLKLEVTSFMSCPLLT